MISSLGRGKPYMYTATRWDKRITAVWRTKVNDDQLRLSRYKGGRGAKRVRVHRDGRKRHACECDCGRLHSYEYCNNRTPGAGVSAQGFPGSISRRRGQCQRRTTHHRGGLVHGGTHKVVLSKNRILPIVQVSGGPNLPPSYRVLVPNGRTLNQCRILRKIRCFVQLVCARFATHDAHISPNSVPPILDGLW